MQAFHKIAVLAVVVAGLMSGAAGQAEAGFKGKFHGHKHFAGKFVGQKFHHHASSKFHFGSHKFSSAPFKHHKFGGHKFDGHHFQFPSHPHLHFGKHK